MTQTETLGLGEILVDRDLFPQTSRRSAVLFSLVILLLAPWIVFYQVGQFDFVTFDDGIHVYSNPGMNPPTAKSVAQYWKGPYQGLYVPLTYTAWAIQAKLAGNTRPENSASLNPRLFHLVNLGFHAANTALVFLVLGALGISPLPAFVGALLFAWHPLQVEPVAWISSLKDLLSGFFVLIALWQYVCYAGKKEKARRHYFLAIGAFLLALLAKPSALVFPLLAGILDIGILRRSWRESLPNWAPWMLLAIPVSWLTKAQQPDRVIEFITPWIYRPVVAADALLFYISKLFFPFFLTLNYGHTAQRVVENPRAVWALAILLLGFAILIRRKQKRVWFTALALFIAYLLPVLGFVPFYFQKYSTVADRFVYLSFLGPCLALSWWLRGSSRLCYAAVFIVLAFLALRSHNQAKMWRDSQSFIRQVSFMNPYDPDVHYGYAIVLSEESQLPGEGSFYSHLLRVRAEERDEATRLKKQEQAIHHYKEAIRLNPKHAFAHNNLGMVFHRKGDLESAISHFKSAVEIEPDMGQAQNNLGATLAQIGRLEEAVTAFENAVRLAPMEGRPHVNLAMAFEQLGRVTLAKKHFSRALEIDGSDAIARQRLAELTASQR